MQATPARRPGLAPALLYDGRIGELYSIFLLNILLTIVTLGIYRFWAITNYRRYFWSRMRFQNERFEYTGTGGQLFVGFLLAGLVLIGAGLVTALAAALLGMIWQPLAALPIFLFYVAIIVLSAGALFSAQRYRLSRTLWCGIRGGMTGSMLAYGVRAILFYLLAAISLLQMLPWAQLRLAERRINASSFGNARFAFQGSARKIYLPFLVTLIGTAALFAIIAAAVFLGTEYYMAVRDIEDPLTVRRIIVAAIPGLIVFSVLSSLLQCWYAALFERHVVGNTSVAGMRLASSMTGRALLWLVLGNLLILLFTIGLGLPIVMHRNAGFLARTLWTDRAIDPAALTQSTLAVPRYGEGMLQQLDAGVF